MTTIAWDGLTLAADSQACFDGRVQGITNKIGRTSDGYLWAFTGYSREKAPFVAWAEKREGSPPKMKDGLGILIHPDGTVTQWEQCAWTQIDAEHHAFGSGERIALGAMLAGADAKRAIEIACQVDIHTGGPVQSIRLGGKRPTVNKCSPKLAAVVGY